jgi:hypothetical protein
MMSGKRVNAITVIFKNHRPNNTGSKTGRYMKKSITPILAAGVTAGRDGQQKPQPGIKIPKRKN